MAETFFENPPQMRGTTEQQLMALYGHLAIVCDKLNVALNNISTAQLAPEAQSTMMQVKENKEEIEKKRKSLRELIIKNAERVKADMEEIRMNLSGRIDAISEDFGEFTQTIDSEIVATAEGVLQQYNVMERIQGAEDTTQAFINRINQYIFTGLLDNGEVGIAIGTNVTDATTGQLIPDNKMATFTSSEMAFYQNGTKVAYFSGTSFVIERGEVKKSMVMGNFQWQIFADGSMGLMKV